MNYSQHDGGTPENVVITDKGGRDTSWNLLQVNFWWVPKLLLFVVSGWGRGDQSTPGSPPCLPFSESFSSFCKRHGLNFLFRPSNILGKRASLQWTMFCSRKAAAELSTVASRTRMELQRIASGKIFLLGIQGTGCNKWEFLFIKFWPNRSF